MKVTLGIPSQGWWKDATGVSLLQGLQHFPHDVHLSAQRGCYLDQNREAIMEDALKHGSEKVLFVDTDMLFPLDAMCKIVAHTKSIVGAAYNEKRLPPVSTVKMDDGKGGYLIGTQRFPDKPFICAAVATGFLAIHLPSFTARVPAPWFQYDHVSKDFMGEDIYFCRHARKHGAEIWCDPTLGVRHIGDYAY